MSVITSAMLPSLLGRPVAYQAVFTKLHGVTVQGAIFLSQALFLSGTPTARNRSGWFWKEQQGDCDSWEAETGMSAKQQLTARRQLTQIGVLEEVRKGVPAKTWYRVDCERLALLLAQALEAEEAAASPHGFPDSPDGRICNLPTGETRVSEPEPTEPPDESFLTETTTEITPSLSDAGESIFDQAAQRDDQGESLSVADRQFVMHLDWKPEPQPFAMACLRRRLPTETEYTASELLDFVEHFAEQPKRQSATAWTNRFARWVHENRQRQQPANANGDSRHAHRRDTDASRHERDRIRQSLADPSDTSWSVGFWDEPGAAGRDFPVDQPGVHSADGPVPQDVGERFPKRTGADVGQTRDGGGAGAMDGIASTAGNREGDERDPAVGEYMAADDPGLDQGAFTDAGGFRSAGHG